jgi:hypothetical protein
VAFGGHEHGDSAARCFRSAATRTSWCFSARIGWSQPMKGMDEGASKKMQGNGEQPADQEHGE